MNSKSFTCQIATDSQFINNTPTYFPPSQMYFPFPRKKNS